MKHHTGSTTLAQTLAANRETAAAFAKRIGVSPHTVYKLCGLTPPSGYGDKATKRLRIDSDMLQLISVESGVPIGTLVEDAIEGGA